MPSKSFSSSPAGTSETGRHRAVLTLLALLLTATPSVAEDLRLVLVEVQIQAGSTLDQGRLNNPAVRTAAETEIAKIAHEAWLYLDWQPASQVQASDAPRLVLELTDGPRGACDPPAVRARFVASLGDVRAWTSRELDFSELCDLAAPEMSTEALVERARQIASAVFADADAMKVLEERFLSDLVISKSLEPDLGEELLYLPLPALKAKPESLIEVRFDNAVVNRLQARPADATARGTVLLILTFSCQGKALPPLPAPATWHPLMGPLLEQCPNPWVYMKEYRPQPTQTEHGLVASLDDEEPLL